MNDKENNAIEGEIVDNTKTSKDNIVKSFKVSDLTPRQRKFIKAYKEVGVGTKAAKMAGYSDKGAGQQASALLKNPKVLAILNDSVEQAEGVIKDLMNTSDNPQIKLAAAKEVLDRTIGKPIQRSESVSVTISVEQMLNSED